jgi:hypothetical protein
MAALVVAGRSPADVTVAQRSSSPSTGRYETAAGGLVTMPRTEQADQARAWLRSTGFDVVVEDRDRRDELMRTGFAGLASENHTHWAHLVSLRDSSVSGQLAGCVVRYRDVYSPLSMATMAASIAGWFESNHGPLRQVVALT